MIVANFKPKVQGDTIRGIIIPFNIPVSSLNIVFQIRTDYGDKLLYECSSESGISEYESNKALIEKFETDDFEPGNHNYEIKVAHKTDGWDKVVYRGKFPIIKKIIKP